MMTTEKTEKSSRGRPVGAIGFGRFTPEEAVAFQAGLLDEAIRAAQAAVPPPVSREDMYAALFGG